MRLFIPALVVLLAVAGDGLLAQSLADVAKKEEERRKAVKESGKVYTNKDLGTLPPGTPAPPPPPPAAAAAAKETEKPEDKEPPKDQAYWSGRLNELRTALQRDETYVEALQTRVNSLSADFVNRDDPAQRAVISADRQKATAELDRLKTQIAATKKAIADLEEEARRAGVPPGWLR
jgi:hypothetical protein